MSTTDFNLPKGLHIINGKNKLNARGLKSLRGINGSLQWLSTNSRDDLAAKVPLSASETANPTIESLQQANKIVRQAHPDDPLPFHIHAIPFDLLNFGVFSDSAWGVISDGSSQGGYLVYASPPPSPPRLDERRRGTCRHHRLEVMETIAKMSK